MINVNEIIKTIESAPATTKFSREVAYVLKKLSNEARQYRLKKEKFTQVTDRFIKENKELKQEVERLKKKLEYRENLNILEGNVVDNYGDHRGYVTIRMHD